MKMINAINLAIADHRAASKGQEDYEFIDALRDVRDLLELINRVATEKEEGE